MSTLLQILEYASAQSSIDQTREFAHYQYYYLLAMNESIRRNVSDFIVVCIMFLNMLSCSHLVDRLRNRCTTQYYCLLLIDDHVWCTIESRNEITRRTIFSLSKIERILYFSLTWSSFEHEILASVENLSKKTIFLLTWLLHRCLIASKWLEEALWSWSSHLTDSNWSKRLQRSSQLRQNDNCFWTLFLRNLLRSSCLLRFRWYYAVIFARSRLLLRSRRRSSHEQI